MLTVKLRYAEYGLLIKLPEYLQHMQTFKSIANTEKFVIQAKDNAVIFFKIPELHKTHYKFVNSLGKKVEGWSTDQEVGAVFRDFVGTFCFFRISCSKDSFLKLQSFNLCI